MATKHKCAASNTPSTHGGNVHYYTLQLHAANRYNTVVIGAGCDAQSFQICSATRCQKEDSPRLDLV